MKLLLFWSLAAGTLGCSEEAAKPDDAGADASAKVDASQDGSGGDANNSTELGALWKPSAVGAAETTRLCDGVEDPDALKDKIRIDCQLEGELLAPDLPDAPTALVVHSWNVERGYNVDEQIGWLQNRADSPLPDVLLLTEADRGCKRTGYRNVTRDIAKALKMNYAYAVEFVELGGGKPENSADCEHGNALLSRWPMRDVIQLRHASQESWWPSRLGGRVAVAATIVTTAGPVRVWALHLESHLSQKHRAAQALEVADIAVQRGLPTVAGGDLNAGLYFADLLYDRVGTPEAIDLVLKNFMARGFKDAHLGIPRAQRKTHDSGNVLDFILTLNLTASGAAICPSASCDGLSDHLPIWAVVRRAVTTP